MSYEFTHEENQTIGRTGLWAIVLGAVLIVLALLNLRGLVEEVQTLQKVITVIAFAVSFTIGLSFVLGGNALRKVVNTQGDDITHMLKALGSLTTAFTIRIAIMIFILVIVGLGILAAGCLGAMAAGS